MFSVLFTPPGSSGGGEKPPRRPALTQPPQIPRIPWRTVAIVAAAILGFAFVRDCFIIVQAGERAVIYSKLSGVKPYELDEGLHFNVPIVWEPTIYNTQTRTYTMSGGANEHDVSQRSRHALASQVPDDSLVALTSDGLPVTLDLSVRFHLDPDNVWRLHKEIGADYIGKIIRPELRSHTRIAVAEFPAAKVFSAERRTIESNIERRLTDKLGESYILVDEVLLRDVRFSDAFQVAIIQKQIAQQNAQRMKYVLEKELKEKQRKIILAEGEAQAIRLRGQAVAANAKVTTYEYVRKVAPNMRILITDGRRVPVPTGP